MFEAPPPDPTRLTNLLDMTVLMLSGFYKDREFIRVGYYIRNSLRVEPPVDDKGEPILPAVIHPEDVVRNVLIEEPRATRFQIPWDGNESELLDMLQVQLSQETNTLLQGEGMTMEDDENAISLENLGIGDAEDDEEDETSDDDMMDIDIGDDD